MKSIRLIALGALVTLGILSMVLYGSCSKDSCGAVTCLNKGTCSGGMCQCAKGIEGANCEIIYRNRYKNTYKGNVLDTLGYADTNYSLVFDPGTDTTDYTKMTIDLKYRNALVVTLNIKLDSNSSAGSAFTVKPSGTGGSTYIGSGSVTPYFATLRLEELDSIGAARIYEFYSFAKR